MRMKKGIGKKIMVGLGLGMLCFALSQPVVTIQAGTTASFSYVEGEEQIAYKGVASASGVNVRTGAGTDNPIVQFQEKNLTLDNKDEVAIIAEKTAGGDVWYQIKFVKDGVECKGFVHSAYVTKTTDIITPDPTPTPIPTNTPTPTPEPEEPTTTVAPTKAPDKDVKEENSGSKILLVLFSLLMIGIVVLILFWQLKKRSEVAQSSSRTSNKINQLKETLTQKEMAKENPIPTMRRKNDGVYGKDVRKKDTNILEEDEAEQLAGKERARIVNEELMEEQRRRGMTEKAVADASDDMMQVLSKEEIDKMKPGDMICHKYFGKGVVYDNSDIKVIEISFGPDRRFLNKDSCASKKLLKK